MQLYGIPFEQKRYSLEVHDFRTPVKQALARGLGSAIPDLAQLHTILDHTPGPVARQTDQQTPFHKAFSENIEATNFYDVYHAFLRKVIRPLVGEDIYTQVDPNFRVQLPGNRAVGEYHRDRDFGHRNIINFWLPLTDACGTNGLHIKWEADQPPRPIPVPLGSFLCFDAENLLHGNEENTTPVTRVSLDFRVIPKRLYEPSEELSINMKRPLTIEPGGYYEDRV